MVAFNEEACCKHIKNVVLYLLYYLKFYVKLLIPNSINGIKVGGNFKIITNPGTSRILQ